MTDRIELFYRDAEQVWGHGELAAVDDQYAEDMVFHTHGDESGVHGRAGYRQVVRAWRNAFSDMQVMVIGEVREEDNLVAGRWLVTGTHTSDWYGIPPTGRRIELEDLVVFRFVDGVIDEIWQMFDPRPLLTEHGEAAEAESTRS